MVKKLVIHAAFTYTDKTTKQRRRAFRGDVIDVGKDDAERGARFGAFGTEADLAPPGLDEGVVDLPSESPTSTPVVPHISAATILQGAIRDRLGVKPGAKDADVLAALDAALEKAQTPPAAAPAPQELVAPPAPAEPVIVNLPDTTEQNAATGDQGEPSEAGNDDEGQADEAEASGAQVERPPLSATKKRWETFAVSQGMPAGEAAAKNKDALIALYGTSED